MTNPALPPSPALPTKGPLYVGAQNDALFIIAGHPPAKSNDYPDHSAHREVVATIHDHRPEIANLFAASQDMFEALECVMAALVHPTKNGPLPHEAVEKARAALRRARGEA